MGYVLYIVLGVLVFFGLIGIRIIRPTQRALVERLGKYKRYSEAGFHWIIPVIDKMIKVNITERMMDIRPQDIITKDNLNARVDLVVYYQVKKDEENVKKSRYNVDDFEEQIISLAQTTARNVIGDMVFKDVNSKRNILNSQLRQVLDTESNNWGVKVVRVEMREITPPEDVQDTMNKVIKAENEKDAARDFATATETKADGERRAAIKKAQGIGEGKKIVASAEAFRIKTVHEAAQKYFKGNAQKLRQYDVTQASLKDNTKIVVTEKGLQPQIILGNIPIENKK